MVRQVVSSALALGIVFGAAAYLPAAGGVCGAEWGIAAQAAEDEHQMITYQADDDYTIKCFRGSAAERYAEENGSIIDQSPVPIPEPKLDPDDKEPVTPPEYSTANPPTGGGGYENISNDLSKATVTGIKNKVYTGKAQTQNFTVKSGSYTLKKDYEYSVTYKNNTKVGTASVIIEGKGYFAGQKITKTFKITGKSLTKASVSGVSNKVYTGKAIKPAPVVKLGGKTLKKGTDYTVSYKNNTKVGKATVTIKGKGAYTGTITKTFKINPKKTTIKKATSPKTRQLKVSYGKVKGVTGYQVKYSTSKKFTKKTTKTVTVKGAGKTSKTIKKLKKGKTYYVKVRSYKVVNGVKYYGAYSAVKKVKVK
ncbi:MAG: hypothetical protein IJ696_04925 [Ruminococcus sp.]|nr:hypothetical protein [Ruminococcus sp.]